MWSLLFQTPFIPFSSVKQPTRLAQISCLACKLKSLNTDWTLTLTLFLVGSIPLPCAAARNWEHSIGKWISFLEGLPSFPKDFIKTQKSWDFTKSLSHLIKSRVDFSWIHSLRSTLLLHMHPCTHTKLKMKCGKFVPSFQRKYITASVACTELATVHS